jgi:hypothetical protein
MKVVPALRLCLSVIATCLLAGGVGSAEGNASKGRELPSPAKSLQAAVKNLTKAENYKTGVEILGGISDKEDHEVTEVTVKEAYEGDVHGSLMHMSQPKAFRLPKKGVAYIDGQWRNILSDMKTTRLERLFAFPEVILNRALANVAQSGRWLTPEEEKAKGYEDRSNDSDDPDEDENDSDEDSGQGKKASAKDKKVETKPLPGKTAVLKTRGGAVTDGPPPRVIHVEVPPKEALVHFTEVQNSGCMSAG